MRFIYRLTLLFLLTGSAHAQEKIFEPEDFAWGMKLNTSSTSAFYQLSIPQTVYQGVTRHDLGDLRVFNGQGQMVPYELKLTPLQQLKESSRQTVQLFPLYGSQTTSIKAISLNLSQRINNGYMGITASEQVPKQNEILYGYLIQLWDSTPHPRAASLQLDWQESSQGRVHRLKVELSNDLENWTVLNDDAVVTDLHFNGNRLLQNSISLADTSSRYLRLSPVKGSEIIQLRSAWMTPIDQNEKGKRQQLSIQEVVQNAGAKDKSTDELLFELPGPFPAAELEVLPSEQNTFVKARLYSRFDHKSPWQYRSSGMIYNLTADGAVLRRTKLHLNQETDRYWKLVTQSSTGGFGSSPPKLVWHWSPHQLLYSARGDGPFVLAYGSGKAGLITGSGLHVFAHNQQTALVNQQVQPGEQYELKGEEALSKTREVDWKQVMLWGVLILSALLLVAMAWSTLRQMRQGDNNPAP
ncbi:DUF3999 domain-containing protein [Motiliproteus sp. MSK22-1]|uniref:DUF3999 domain-containing protein n=1 Tax=Motiliproteus sp. MSK22-1 TaxID=1897630 RepID=UPI00097775F3|nr:DUF3999 domain-containing protein [Motiliproteus sp. MSK22-1]OMH38000.1 hypothetical protein BGP75_06850 [Motiliproteus sp. MSK22-1]